MDTDLIIKVATAIVVVFGAVLGLFQFLTTKRSHVYQNSKVEMELLSQSIAAHEAESDYKTFLVDVRKEKITFLVFGIPIPNADLERVIAYYRKAEGRVTTGDIAKAWQYRGPSTKPLSFQLSASTRAEYILKLVYAVCCIVAAAGGVLAASVFMIRSKDVILLICLSVISFIFIVWTNQDLFTAVGLAKLEKERSKGGSTVALPLDGSVGK
ncbi:MAG TPA: hypothetical protein VNL17_03285 [Verrucomicrobiae bacterium]|nr:hypothetical protein [Verrucomicrobiae bacterium]